MSSPSRRSRNASAAAVQSPAAISPSPTTPSSVTTSSTVFVSDAIEPYANRYGAFSGMLTGVARRSAIFTPRTLAEVARRPARRDTPGRRFRHDALVRERPVDAPAARRDDRPGPGRLRRGARRSGGGGLLPREHPPHLPRAGGARR